MAISRTKLALTVAISTFFAAPAAFSQVAVFDAKLVSAGCAESAAECSYHISQVLQLDPSFGNLPSSSNSRSVISLLTGEPDKKNRATKDSQLNLMASLVLAAIKSGGAQKSKSYGSVFNLIASNMTDGAQRSNIRQVAALVEAGRVGDISVDGDFAVAQASSGN